ncbi:MAG: hypothetical protein M3O70_13365 [Actinomycetota bacterium]|nr:hypothetical protein [Actinomycetota bacterium]
MTELLHLNTDYVRQLARDGGIPLTASRKAGGAGSHATRSPPGGGRYPARTTQRAPSELTMSYDAGLVRFAHTTSVHWRWAKQDSYDRWARTKRR